MVFSVSYHAVGGKSAGVRRVGIWRCAITTHSTEARVSQSLIVKLSVSALCARSVNSGVRFGNIRELRVSDFVIS